MRASAANKFCWSTAFWAVISANACVADKCSARSASKSLCKVIIFSASSSTFSAASAAVLLELDVTIALPSIAVALLSKLTNSGE